MGQIYDGVGRLRTWGLGLGSVSWVSGRGGFVAACVGSMGQGSGLMRVEL